MTRERTVSRSSQSERLVASDVFLHRLEPRTLDALRQAIELAPHDPDPWQLLAVADLLRGKLAQSLGQLGSRPFPSSLRNCYCELTLRPDIHPG